MARFAGIARLGVGCAVVLVAARVYAADAATGSPNWRVGVLADDLPFSRTSTRGDPSSVHQGLYVDWWRSLGRRTKRSITFVPCHDSLDCVARLKRGEVDFVGPAPYIDDHQVLFSRPVNRRYVSAVSRVGTRMRGPPDLAHRRVALLPKVRAERVEVASWMPASIARINRAQARARLSNGTLDVVLTDRNWGQDLAVAVKRTPLWFRWQHIYARVDDAARLEALDAAIDHLDPSAARIGGQGHAVGADALLLPREARPKVDRAALALLARRPTVRLAASSWEPLTVERDGWFDGLALRIVEHHVQRAGLTPVFMGHDDWPQIKEDARAGLYDGIGYIVVNAASRLDPLLFTDAMVDLPMVAIARSDEEFWAGLKDIRDKTLVADPLYGEVPFILPSDQVARIMGAERPAQALEMVRSGEADAWLEYLPVARHAIRSAKATDVKLAFRIGGPEGARTGLHPKWAPIIPLINESIRATSAEDLEQVYTRWAAQPDPDEQSSWRRFAVVMAAVVSVLVIGVLVLARNLRREHRTVRQRERALRRAQLLAGIGSVELQPPYENVYLDGETANILGLEPSSEVMALRDHIAVFRESDQVRAAIDSAKVGTEPIRIDVTVDGPPSKIFTYELAPPQDVDGRSGVLTGTIRDVTAERARQAHEKGLEQQVLHLQKQDAIGRLAGGIAHDFNNILAASIGYNELALMELPTRHPARKSMEHVLAASARARDLVQQILTFSRRDEQAYEAVRWDSCVKDTLNFLRASVPATVNFVSEICTDPVWVQGDRTQLTQVLVNLITNAVDAMNGSGTVTVRLCLLTEPPALLYGAPSATEFARLSVVDSGPGIDGSIRQQIFEPFFTTKAPGKGTGLGLSIVDGVMRAHRGHIEVRSVDHGGACFEVTLPTTTLETNATPSHAQTPRNGAGQSVLVVDDEPSLTRVFRKILERHGFQVIALNSAVEALELLYESPSRFDVVLTDLTMPELSGVEFAKRALRNSRSMTIILLTGYRAVAPAGSDGLFFEVLQKPVTAEELVASVSRALRTKDGMAVL